MEQVIELHGKPKVLRLDNGPEPDLGRLYGVVRQSWHRSALHPTWKPDQNAFIERKETYRDEVLDAYVFETIEQVREATEAWLREYNEERPHTTALAVCHPLRSCLG